MTELHFEIPEVRVDNTLWTWLAKEKLNNLRLSTDAVVDVCCTRYERVGNTSRLVVSSEDNVHEKEIKVFIHNVNTAKEFKEFDRGAMFGHLKPPSIHTVNRPELHVVSFADLKSYTFTYNVAIPSLAPSDYSFTYKSTVLVLPSPPRPRNSSNPVSILRGTHILDFNPESVQDGDLILVQSQCSGLPFFMRTVLTSIAHSLPRNSPSISVGVHVLSSSILYRGIDIRPCDKVRVIPNWVRWTHPVTQQPTTIQSADLKRFLDPATIATEAVELNIKLIKWRLIPRLEPEKMSSLKFLLIGAGTLGCAVARSLLAWGVSHITLVDSGRVSYSNPPRQWLFNLEDAAENAPKAERAAHRLREILPHANLSGIDLSVPLPGHPSDLVTLDQSFSQLESLISSHDVVFMLTDSRESRWLPSLMVAAASPTQTRPFGVSVALGFDSYLVKTQTGACYFCNDVNAPSESSAFRTLDQQCTVTRPGIAAIASSVAVELVANLATSVAGFESDRFAEDDVNSPRSLLGSLPDQIRGFLGSFQSFPAVTERFEKCICCSSPVVEEFKRRKIDFVREVINDGNVLMKVSGLDEFNGKVADNFGDESFVWDDADDEKEAIGA
jgi:molybdopterin/thiamine biosynthesis adenylyltransferase